MTKISERIILKKEIFFNVSACHGGVGMVEQLT
jgi:hypothetical protein